MVLIIDTLSTIIYRCSVFYVRVVGVAAGQSRYDTLYHLLAEQKYPNGYKLRTPVARKNEIVRGRR